MNTFHWLGMGLMGWAIAPTPEDVPLYGAGVAPGAIKDAGLFALGLASFLAGTFIFKGSKV